MGEQETIALNIQLPAASLDGVTRLVEQLRCLAAELRTGGTASASASSVHTLESGENPLFDPQRYQGFLQQAGAAPDVQDGTYFVQPADTDTAGGPTGRDGSLGEPHDPTTSEARVESVLASLPDPVIAEAGVVEGPAGAERETVPLPGTADLTDAAASAPNRGISAAEASADGEKGEGRSVPEVRTAVSDLGPVSGDVLSRIEPPPAAGYGFSQLQGTGGGYRGRVEEAPVTAEDRSLTAREVSRAFRRDGRRYDNGFQLY